jgi:DNA-binding CsgD family transcriptional regulator
MTARPPKKKTPKKQPRVPAGRGSPTFKVHIPGWTPKPTGGEQIAHHKTKESELLVQTLVGLGVTQGDIADILDISLPTLSAHYRQQLTLGAHIANAAVAGNLFRMATDPRGGSASVNAAIWWTKARMNWSETRKEAISADVRTLSANIRDLTDEQLLEIIQRGRGREGAGGETVEPGKLQ